MISAIKWIIASILLLLTMVVGIVIGIAAFFALASVVNDPRVLGIAAVGCGGTATCCLAHLLGRWFARNHRRRLVVSLGTVTALLLVVVGGALVFRPRGFEGPDPVDLGGVRFEVLTTGSRLAYRIIPARATVRRGGVIFIHGGPGANAVTNDSIVAALSPLADEGYDICLYDQIGSGLSARLADPQDYTVARQVADLEALRQRLGWERPVLIGKSWGAQLIARYAAKHPLGISAVVLVSPGPLRLADWAGRETGSIFDRISDDGQEAFYDLLDVRLMTAMLLLRINPQAATRFLPEAEAERYGSALLAALSPGAVCNPQVLPDHPRPFLNFWVAQMIKLSLLKEPQDHLEGLMEARFPVLVLRGECDYARDGIAADYIEAFSHADLVEVADAGHFMLLERPQAFQAEVRRFLVGLE